MAWKKGQSGNPGGRPKQVRCVRAMAKMDAVAAYETLRGIMQTAEKESDRKSAAVDILRLAGASFASEAVETKDQAEASRATTQPTPSLEEAAGGPELPLN